MRVKANNALNIRKKRASKSSDELRRRGRGKASEKDRDEGEGREPREEA
jgi:hypothetical protein